MNRSGLLLFVCLLLISVSLLWVSSQSIEWPQIQVGKTDPTVERVAFLFVGDIMLGRYVETLIAEHGPMYPFAGLAHVYPHYDHVIGNLEAPLNPFHTQTPKGSLIFSTATSSLSGLLKYITAVSLGNNHILDQGEEAVAFTRDYLAANNIVAFGGPTLASTSVAYLEHDELVVAVISIAAVQSYDGEAVRDVIESAAKESAMQIVSVHWGEEYTTYHSPAQAELAEFLIDAGADAIIGHHPHTIQDIGWYKGVPIFYSLGNFIFDQYFSDATQIGLAIELVIENQTITYRLIPIGSKEYPSSPHLLSISEREAVLRDVAAKSDPRLAESIAERGSIELGPILASFPNSSMIVESK